MALICFDNHVLIWGIKEQSEKGQEHMIPRTKYFIENIDDKNDDVLIPAIIVAEFLIRIPTDLHATIINLFNRNWIIAPFDALAASKFSSIWQANNTSDEVKQLMNKGATKAELRADSMFVATAVSRKAECIYSHDKGVKAFAKGFIDVKEIPFIPQQQSAFDTKDNNIDWGKLPKMNETS